MNERQYSLPAELQKKKTHMGILRGVKERCHPDLLLSCLTE